MSEIEKLRMMIAEDENHIRMMLKSIAGELDAEVVAEASNGREAVDLFRLLKPQVTLMDINMPVLSGLDALEKIKETNPNACVIMLTSVADLESVRRAVKLGASNYILKGTPVDEMGQMISETWSEHQNAFEG